MAQVAARTVGWGDLPNTGLFKRERSCAEKCHENFMAVMSVVIVLLLIGLCFTVVTGVIGIMNQKFPEPIAATAPATVVTASTAKLNGFVNPNSHGGTQYFFEHGPMSK